MRDAGRAADAGRAGEAARVAGSARGAGVARRGATTVSAGRAGAGGATSGGGTRTGGGENDGSSEDLQESQTQFRQGDDLCSRWVRHVCGQPLHTLWKSNCASSREVCNQLTINKLQAVS